MQTTRRVLIADRTSANQIAELSRKYPDAYAKNAAEVALLHQHGIKPGAIEKALNTQSAGANFIAASVLFHHDDSMDVRTVAKALAIKPGTRLLYPFSVALAARAKKARLKKIIRAVKKLAVEKMHLSDNELVYAARAAAEGKSDGVIPLLVKAGFRDEWLYHALNAANAFSRMPNQEKLIYLQRARTAIEQHEMDKRELEHVAAAYHLAQAGNERHVDNALQAGARKEMLPVMASILKTHGTAYRVEHATSLLQIIEKNRDYPHASAALRSLEDGLPEKMVEELVESNSKPQDFFECVRIRNLPRAKGLDLPQIRKVLNIEASNLTRAAETQDIVSAVVNNPKAQEKHVVKAIQACDEANNFRLLSAATRVATEVEGMGISSKNLGTAIKACEGERDISKDVVLVVKALHGSAFDLERNGRYKFLPKASRNIGETLAWTCIALQVLGEVPVGVRTKISNLFLSFNGNETEVAAAISAFKNEHGNDRDFKKKLEKWASQILHKKFSRLVENHGIHNDLAYLMAAAAHLNIEQIEELVENKYSPEIVHFIAKTSFYTGIDNAIHAEMPYRQNEPQLVQYFVNANLANLGEDAYQTFLRIQRKKAGTMTDREIRIYDEISSISEKIKGISAQSAFVRRDINRFTAINQTIKETFETKVPVQ